MSAFEGVNEQHQSIRASAALFVSASIVGNNLENDVQSYFRSNMYLDPVILLFRNELKLDLYAYESDMFDNMSPCSINCCLCYSRQLDLPSYLFVCLPIHVYCLCIL